MINDRLFSISNKLKDYSVVIGDVDLIKETILSVEISYKNDSPVVLGKIIFDDLYDMNLLQTWRDIEVQVSYIDVFDEKVLKNFVILSVTEQYDNEFKKVLVVEVQDKFSYVLEHSYISKGFIDNPINALTSYATKLEIDALEDLTLDFTTLTSTYNFIVPKNISNLEFFLKEFYKHGLKFYQNKSSVLVKSLADLDPAGLPDNGLFVNETDNQYYKNKIIDIISSLNRRDSIEPKTRSFAYDFDTKSINYDSTNSMSQYSINSDVFELQDTFGYRDRQQQHLDFNEHTSFLKDSFLNQAQLDIIINGYAKNDLNQIYELQLKGNISTTDSQSKGNLVMNGYYISNKVTDKIVGDSLIQKVSLHRSDLTLRE